MSKKEIKTTADGRKPRAYPAFGCAVDRNGKAVPSSAPDGQRLHAMGRNYRRVMIPYTPAELKAAGVRYGAHVQVVRKEMVT